MVMDSSLKHIIIILHHGVLDSLSRLVSFFDNDFIVLIHVDRTVKLQKKAIRDFENVYSNAKIFQKYRIFWGGIGILKTELFLLKYAISRFKFDYVHFLSGQDYLIKDINYFKLFFEQNNGKQFIEFNKLPYKNWEGGSLDRFMFFRLNDFINYRSKKGRYIIDMFNNIQRHYSINRRIPNHFSQLYGGSNWMSISEKCAIYIISHMKDHKSFFNRLRFTFGSDEVFFHTVVMNSEFKQSVVNDNLRYIDWNNPEYGPKILGYEDWVILQESKALIARKFHSIKSKILMDLLDIKTRIQN